MKKVLILVFLFVAVIGFGQEIGQPSEGKSMVYFVRTSSYGFLINFKYFDGEKYLGKYATGYYMAYECEPGKHLFWVKGENMDFVEAELEANKVYIIDAEPQMGMVKAGVKLKVFENNAANYKNDKRYLKHRNAILKEISNSKKYILSETEQPDENILELSQRGNEKYQKLKSEGKKITVLTPEMSYQ